MNDNFALYKNVKDFSFEIMNYINNIPNNFRYIKEGIQYCFVSSIRLIRYYVVNMNDTYRIKSKYLKELIVELSMIDYYLECLYRNKVLGKNRYNEYGNKLECIRKLAYGVINSEKKQD